MAEHLRRIGHVLAAFVSALFRFLWRLLRLLGHLVGKHTRLFGLGRAVRDAERRRRQSFENLGRMVFLLSRRNLVRNADLLAECEKIVALEAELDRLGERVDQARALRPPTPPVEVAAAPLEIERLGAVDTGLSNSTEETATHG